VKHGLKEAKLPVINLQLTKLTEGAIIGLEDLHTGSTKHSFSLVCNSTKGSIFVINKKELNQLEKMTRIWSQIVEQTQVNTH